eukprot:Selendium_serpulae@DN738_c0_g1_i1.p1
MRTVLLIAALLGLTEARASRRLQGANQIRRGPTQAGLPVNAQAIITEECTIRPQPQVAGTWIAQEDGEAKQVVMQFEHFNHCVGVGNVHSSSMTGFSSSFDGSYVQVRPEYFRARTLGMVYDTQAPYKVVGTQVNEFDFQLTSADSGATSYPGRATYYDTTGNVLGGYEFSIKFERFEAPSLFEPFLSQGKLSGTSRR